MLDRWEKLNRDFFNSKTQMYDLSKVPDVYDMIRYDILHNSNAKLEECVNSMREYVPSKICLSRKSMVLIRRKKFHW